MRKPRAWIAALALALPGLLAWAAAEPVGAQHEELRPSSLAEYNGRTIDLAVSWEGAQACRIAEPINQCFDTEAELDELPPPAGRDIAPLTNCGSSVRLYDFTSYGTPVLELWQRWTTHSLSIYGFANRTSSYRIGACSATFYDSSSNIYPGATTANSSSPSMASGWDNRVTRVYIS